ENEGKIVVANVAEQGPAADAGMRQGDVVASIRDQDVGNLADFYRKLWSCGPAGTEIPIEIVRDNRSLWLRVKSADRSGFLKKPRVH
ncbi:MAG: PDZ domain-containing protein, partial [Hyphomicrobiales bacterium]|nr:PDZ domain-containing protein [Hyphomicrobiales bacterium]